MYGNLSHCLGSDHEIIWQAGGHRAYGGPQARAARRARAVSQSKRRVVESPWSQVTSECPRFGHPPRLDKDPFGLQDREVRGAGGAGQAAGTGAGAENGIDHPNKS